MRNHSVESMGTSFENYVDQLRTLWEESDGELGIAARARGGDDSIAAIKAG